MSYVWLDEVIAHLGIHQSVARLVIIAAKGSAPRGTGAEMIVTADTQTGTIGGGALEYQASHLARQNLADMPASGFARLVRNFALGPDLGQCCGGNVRVLSELFTPAILPELIALQEADAPAYCHELTTQNMPLFYDDDVVSSPHLDKAQERFYMPAKSARQRLYIYGAGHVGRALIAATNDLGLDRVWVDSAPERFPDNVTDDVTIVPARDMARIAHHAPRGAFHIIVTYSHQIDEAITYALLAKQGSDKIGLIGSRTKKARFDKRFAAQGLSQAAIAGYQCPVGLSAIQGKSPPHVALSIAGQIAVWLEEV